MKQFFVFIYSQFSPASVKCENIIKSLPPDIKLNYLCVDNLNTRTIIQNDKTLDINIVPSLLIVNTTDGRITKYEGKKCFDYLIQYKNQQTSLLQQAPSPPRIQQQQQPQPLPLPQKEAKHLPPKPPKVQQQQQPIIYNEEDSFSNPPDMTQTSSLELSENDDDEMPLPPQLPPPSKKSSKQQQQLPPSPGLQKGKVSLLAQATAMQKSRLMDDEFSTTKKNNLIN